MEETTYVPGFAYNPNLMSQILEEIEAPQASTIKMFGKVHQAPRLTAWIGDSGRDYTFGGRTFRPSAWTPTMESIRSLLSTVEGVRFNSCLVNLYRDGRDSVGMHADDEPELGPNPDDIRIASLTLGARRNFRIKGPRVDATYNLGEGDLLIMRGALQRDHKHGIAKTKKAVGPRLNLTFRVIR